MAKKITNTGDLKKDDYQKIKESKTETTKNDGSTNVMLKTDGYAIIDDKQSNTWVVRPKTEQVFQVAPAERETVSLDELDFSTSPPQLVQNDYLFPEIVRKDPITNLYEYSYEMKYDAIDLDTDLKMVEKSINFENDYMFPTVLKQTTKFNRFKVPVLGDAFMKGFGHVFFTRPNCNILTYDGLTYKLAETMQNDSVFENGFKNKLHILKQLCGHTEFNHDFLMYLTNKAKGFELSDKTLETSTYGTNLMGHSIQYGRTAEKSKTAGTITVPFEADRNMDIYEIHNFWIKYITGVYRGLYRPNPENIVNKTIDYACACYYFVTAEDFETIIYWTKLYGVFPTSTPDNVLSWRAGNPILNPEPTITYAFSWRSEDNDPRVILDFNNNACYGNYTDFKYMPTYEPRRYGPGNTWVEAPFVEFLKNSSGLGTEPKLRWRPTKDL